MLQAIGKNIVIIPIYEKQRGCIVIPESAKFKKYDGFVYGLVESVGSRFGLKFAGEKLKRGDKVIIQRNEGKVIRFEGQEYLKVKEERVMARLDD